MKPIKRKLLGVFACMLLLATIPLAAGMSESEMPLASGMIEPEPDSEPTLDIGRVWMRGLLFRCNHIGDENRALALRLHYIEITPTERTTGIVMMNRVIFKDATYNGRMYKVGLGMFTYVFGFFEGGLEIL